MILVNFSFAQMKIVGLEKTEECRQHQQTVWEKSTTEDYFILVFVST